MSQHTPTSKSDNTPVSGKTTCLFLNSGTRCDAGHFGGKPTPGDCLGCKHRVWAVEENNERHFHADFAEDMQKVVDGIWNVYESQKGNEIPIVQKVPPVETQEIPKTDDSADVPDKSRGLGDTIAKATKKVGIKPCGACKKRQALLNKMIPYKGKSADAQNQDTDATDNS